MDAAARYLEHSLRQSCLERSGRRRSERRIPAAKKVDPEGLSFFVASRRVVRPDLQRHLAAIGARAEEVGFNRQLLRELLLAAGAGGADPEHVADVARLIELGGFRALDHAARIEVVRTLAAIAPSRFLAAALLKLTAGVLADLSPDLRHVLLGYLHGPQARSRSRRKALVQWHGHRALELLTRDHLDVRAFLDEVVRPLHILRTAQDLDLAVVVFGDPSDPRSLSYEKSAAFTKKGVLSWSVRSPAVTKRKRFEHRFAELSRREELELITWLESNHHIEDGGIAFGRGAVSSSFDFDRRAEEVARIVASSRGMLAFTRRE